MHLLADLLEFFGAARSWDRSTLCRRTLPLQHWTVNLSISSACLQRALWPAAGVAPGGGEVCQVFLLWRGSRRCTVAH